MMVIYNAIYINKMNNQLSFQNIEHKKSHMTFEIQVLAWTRHTNVGGLNLIMGSQPSPLERQFIYKQTIPKTVQILFYTKIPPTIKNN